MILIRLIGAVTLEINKFLIVGILLVMLTIGTVNAADNLIQNDSYNSSNDESCNIDDFNINVQENRTQDNRNDYILIDDESQSSKDVQLSNEKEMVYDNNYYLFRGDCWVITNNFESSAAITSETLADLTVTGTFRTENDIVGLYWNSTDPIQHPYISYGNHSDYSDVILEFDYEMTGCMDFSNDNINIMIEANTGEIYYLTMSRFIENNHVTLNFNNLTLLPGNSYFNNNGQVITVINETKLNVSNLKFVMFELVPTNFAGYSTQYNIMANENFKCKISNITVFNGEISNEQLPLQPHQYRLCEGYDDINNLNPFRLCKEMRKLGYAEWVDLYIGASYFYEKSGIVGEVIADEDFNHGRTEKMVLDKNTPLNNAFKAWLDCYSRELKNNGVEHLVISVSMENLQCPQSWRQMDYNGNFAMSSWNPPTFLYSPCNEEVIQYIQKVSEACLDITVGNNLQPILQMGETWWWWNQTPYFYDNSTKSKYLAEHGTDLPEYDDVYDVEYDEGTIYWLNQQLVQYSDALREVVKGDKYNDGLYMALFFTPSVCDTINVPPMIRDVNYLYDAYSPSKLDILQIEDYDWVIYENPHHSEAYTIGQKLGFSEDCLHYFGGFVQNPEYANKYWELIKESMDMAIENKFKEVFVWSGSQIRRDNKIIGYDETHIETNDVTTIYNSGENLVVTLKDSKGNVLKGKDILINLDGLNHTITTDENGRAMLKIELIPGNYSSEILFAGDNGYLSSYTNARIIINQITSYIIAPDIITTYNVAKNFIVTLKDDMGNVLVGQKVIVNLNNKDYYNLTDMNGQFKLSLNLAVKEYTAKITFEGSDIYKSSNNTIRISVKKATPKITASSKTFNVKTKTKYYSINLKNNQNKVMKNTKVTLKVNGATYYATTNNYGVAKFSLKKLTNKGTYSAVVTYAGNSNYNKVTKKISISVKGTPKLTAKSATFKKSVKTKKYSITLKTDKYKVMKYTKVTLKVNGITYTAKTNIKGIATFKITKLNKRGKFTGLIKYAGNNYYYALSKKVSITVR